MFEKEAEEYLKDEPKYLIEDNEGNLINIANKVRQAYIAGATENGIQWHDLRKDPNDLPKEAKDCLVVFHNKYSDNIVKDISRYSVELKKWWYIHDLKDMEEEVIAWCEIPQFKE